LNPPPAAVKLLKRKSHGEVQERNRSQARTHSIKAQTMDPMTPNPPQRPEHEEEPQPLQAEPVDAIDEETAKLEAKIRGLQEAGRRGANWFYWVAALSLVNTALMHLGANIHFVVGLGVSAIADAVAVLIATQHPEHALICRTVAITFSVLASGIVFLFGWLANRRYLVPFALAIVLYSVDGLLLILVQNWLSVFFHGYVVFCLWTGFRAQRELNKIERELQRRRSQPDDHPG
jgi:hypothetical protein